MKKPLTKRFAKKNSKKCSTTQFLLLSRQFFKGLNKRLTCFRSPNSTCSGLQLFFLLKVVRQNDTDMKSHFMQLEKVGRGLLRKAFLGEGECYVSLKRGGK